MSASGLLEKELEPLMNRIKEKIASDNEFRQDYQRKEILGKVVEQIKAFGDTNLKQPYCVLHGFIGPYYRITNNMLDLNEILSRIDRIGFKVLFLAVSKTVADIEMRVMKVAVQRVYPTITHQEVLEAWKAECTGSGNPKVLALSHVGKLIFDEIENYPKSKL